MKLLHCVESAGGCGDLVRLHEDERACRCGLSRGRQNSDARAMIAGPCRVLLLNGQQVHAGDRGDWTVSHRLERLDGRAPVRVGS